jgi:hypothetical protein
MEALPKWHCFPTKNEVSNVSADENANNYVAIVVHGNQHDQVGHREL